MAEIRWGTARPVLQSADIARSRAFWCDQLGFEAVVTREDYLLLRSGEAELAIERVERPSAIEVLLHVRGIEAVFAKCDAVHAIAQPLHTHESARRDFVARDPDGNQIRIVEPARHGGRIGWVDLTVEEAEKSRDFWVRVAGFDKVHPVEMDGYQDYTLMSDQRPVVGICHRRGVNSALPPAWMVYFTVDDLETAIAEVEANGGRVLERQQRTAIVADPAGAAAVLYQV